MSTHRSVLKRAALLAARVAIPTLPAGAVRWEEEPQVQMEANLPSVTLSEVSSPLEAPMGKMLVEREDGSLDECLVDRNLWTVQFKVEGWKIDVDGKNDVIRFAKKMRFAWMYKAIREALLDGETPTEDRVPLKLVSEPEPIIRIPTEVEGHTLPVYVYEVRFRFHDYDFDPDPTSVIESIEISGMLEPGEIPILIETTIAEEGSS